MKKKILFVETGKPTNSGAYGGSIKSVIQLIEKIDKSKYEVFFQLDYFLEDVVSILKRKNVTVFYKWNLKNGSDKNHTLKKFVPKFIKKSTIYSLISFYKNNNYVNELVKIINDYRIDIVHGNDRFSANINVIRASKITGVKYIQHQRKFENFIPFHYKKYLKYPYKYVAISNAIKNNLLDIEGLKKNKIELIHNWINTSTNKIYFTNKNSVFFNFLWIGRLVKWKGIEITIKMAYELKRKRFKEFRIHVYGDFKNSTYKKNIFKQIQANNLNDVFIFHGFSDHKNIFKNPYDIYIHTSTSPEPFGRTIIENMFQGIPVIATNMGGVKDIIIDNYNGYLFDPKNIDELLKKINLLDNNKCSTQVVKNARKTVENFFSGKLQSKMINKIYIDMIE